MYVKVIAWSSFDLRRARASLESLAEALTDAFSTSASAFRIQLQMQNQRSRIILTDSVRPSMSSLSENHTSDTGAQQCELSMSMNVASLDHTPAPALLTSQHIMSLSQSDSLHYPVQDIDFLRGVLHLPNRRPSIDDTESTENTEFRTHGIPYPHGNRRVVYSPNRRSSMGDTVQAPPATPVVPHHAAAPPATHPNSPQASKHYQDLYKALRPVLATGGDARVVTDAAAARPSSSLSPSVSHSVVRDFCADDTIDTTDQLLPHYVSLFKVRVKPIVTRVAF